jgi:flagellar protein FlaG
MSKVAQDIGPIAGKSGVVTQLPTSTGGGSSASKKPAEPLRTTDVSLAINPEPVFHAPVVIDAQKEQNIRQAIDQINTVLKDGGRGVSFVLDSSRKTPIVQVTRADTGEVIRQFPNEAVLRVAHNIDKLKGVLFHGLI